MKKLVLIFICFIVFTKANSQPLHVVPWYDWSSKTAFMLSPSPLITGYGHYSDSLSRVYDGVTFYVYNEEYYPIVSWADYYYWYVKAYWWKFIDPDLYEYYYHTNNDYGMASYICGANFYGRYYPTRFAVTFPGRYIQVNYLSPYKIKQCIRKDRWENRHYSERIMAHNKEQRKRNTNYNSNKPRNSVSENNKVVRNNRTKTDKNRTQRNSVTDYKSLNRSKIGRTMENKHNTNVRRNRTMVSRNSSSSNKNRNSYNRTSSNTRNSFNRTGTSSQSSSSVKRTNNTRSNNKRSSNTNSSRQTQSSKSKKR